MFVSTIQPKPEQSTSMNFNSCANFVTDGFAESLKIEEM